MQIFESAAEFRAVHNQSAVTIGKYDGIHLGHQAIISELVSQARKLGVVSVVILSEPQPEEFFRGQAASPRLTRFADKVARLQALGVDVVFRLAFDETTSQTPAEDFINDFLVADLGACAVVVGHDFCFGHQRSGNTELLRKYGEKQGFSVTVVEAMHREGEVVSSTRVRQLLEAGDCASVSGLLGRPYSISGEVVEGRKLGRQLGFPTANIGLEFERLPLNGVFAVVVKHARGITRGVANAGTRPTVDEGSQAHLEVHLFSFARDLYGESLEVMFMHKIRDEQKFDSIDALKQQIDADAAAAKAWFWKGEATVV